MKRILLKVLCILSILIAIFIGNNKYVKAVGVGEQLLNPEEGWQRYDHIFLMINSTS